ncbi:hypothetical protein E3983_07945 [Legionella israelensis]|uniref:Putative iron-sulpher cluster proteins NifU n=1 Tax=Legionella israelensis TaxID=454 RepID=A0A0W0W3M7_9GAMM|nr:iron-sulfur cluster assembly scaffold protein [Legionella israelensis]KTD26897.1 putative iron-sulpher cluster proteins NifU [Legionella israelensis]QBR84298.1 hypothetical protein E3983_07945 [Legionella israelensis]QBS08563.1 hypothetical protein E4T55_01025 [Legionella israelensis]QDP72594.1 iron-sulfur cluster assembly scaffold protein [Legionella israelensis]SCX76088.1 nitrogen fixation protein NifU [Legionella israelensis DSM 19235]
MMYNKLVEDCFFSTEHVGVLNDAHNDCVSFRSSLAGPGGIIELSIRCDHYGLITDACFKTQGNPYTIAMLEWLCRQLEGEPLYLHPRWNYQQILELFDVPDTQYPVAIRIEDIYTEIIKRMKKKLKEVNHDNSDATFE